MIFNPFQTSCCPICGSKLIYSASRPPEDVYYEIYECPVHIPPLPRHASRTHYFVSWDSEDGGAIKSEINIPGFHLMYTPDETVIYKRLNPDSGSYRYALTLNQHFPIDFSDLDKTAERLKLLILFS